MHVNKRKLKGFRDWTIFSKIMKLNKSNGYCVGN